MVSQYRHVGVCICVICMLFCKLSYANLDEGNPEALLQMRREMQLQRRREAAAPEERFVCPPGTYMSAAERRAREETLRRWRRFILERRDQRHAPQLLAYEARWHDYVNSHSRGLIYEDPAWPKPIRCLKKKSPFSLKDGPSMEGNNSSHLEGPLEIAHNFQNNNKYIIIPEKKTIIHLTWKAGTMSLKAYLRCFAGNQSSILESWPNGYFNDSPSDSEDEVEEDEYSEDDDAKS